MLLLVLTGQATATMARASQRLTAFVGGRVGLRLGPPWPPSCDVRRSFGIVGASPGAGGEGESAGAGAGGGTKKNRKAKPSKGGTKGQGAGEETFRLDRLLANRGVGTRTEVTTLIRRGRVKRADTGEVVKYVERL